MELVIFVGALIVSFLVFTWLVKIARATIRTAIAVAVLLLILQLLFGIGPQTLWEQIQAWLRGLSQ